MDPYDTLGVQAGADDETVRAAYLELVRRYPPERFPERFARINRAYEALKTEQDRVQHELFDREPGIRSPFEALLVHFSRSHRPKPPAFEEMKERLRRCSTP